MEGEKSCSNGIEKNKEVTPQGKTSPEDLVAQGRREAACGKHQEAVLLFEEACSELATKHDQMADEMAEPYFLYGKALLEVARQEAGVLGTAVPENEPESNGESDGEEENVGESSHAGGAEASVSGAEQPPASTEATKTEETSEEPPKEDDPGMDVDEPTAATTTEEKPAGSSSNEPTTAAQENEGGRSPGDNEKGEEEDGAGEDIEEDVPTLQLAWEVLELSRIIYDKEADKNASRLAEIHLLLGEINMESDHQEDAVEEFRKALQIRESLLTPDDRRIAECHFQLGMALTFAKEFDKAIESYEFAKGVLKKKLETLTSSGEDGELTKAELKEINELLPDLDSKIEDVMEMKKMAAEQASDSKQDSSSGFDAPQLKGDAKPVQISVRRGRQSPSKDVIKMIRKRGSIGKIENNDNAGDEDESAAKRLKSDDAGKTADAATNDQ